MATALASDKKRLILESARQLLIRRGFQNIVLDDVAREAGVAKGTLFLYYRNKEDLFNAAFSDLVDQLGCALDEVSNSGQRGEDLLHAMVQKILAHLERNKDFFSHFGAGRFPGLGERSCGRLM